MATRWDATLERHPGFVASPEQAPPYTAVMASGSQVQMRRSK